jgi:hypothetical protein
MNVVKGVAAVIYSRTSNVHPTGTNRWFAERYNVPYAWSFYGAYRYLYSNRVTSAFQVGAVSLL